MKREKYKNERETERERREILIIYLNTLTTYTTIIAGTWH
mgnify:CR=1 FL=1